MALFGRIFMVKLFGRRYYLGGVVLDENYHSCAEAEYVFNLEKDNN